MSPRVKRAHDTLSQFFAGRPDLVFNVPDLVRATGQHRQTVFGALAKLIAEGKVCRVRGGQYAAKHGAS